MVEITTLLALSTTRARGSPRFNDASRLLIASVWQSRSPLGSTDGKDCRRWRRLLPRVQQEFRAVEREQPAGARLRIAVVSEASFPAGAFVFEEQAHSPSGDTSRQCAEIFGRLVLEAGQRGAFRFGLQHAAGLSVDIQQVVACAGSDGEFADCNTEGGAQVYVCPVLYNPTRSDKLFIDRPAGAGFRQHRERGSRGSFTDSFLPRYAEIISRAPLITGPPATAA
jgi:hypothetical protein